MAVEAIGVISGVLGIFSFFQDLFQDQDSDSPANAFQFRVGLDGTQAPDGSGSLENAGGDVPDIRTWNENKDFIAITVGDGNYCESGSEVCSAKVEGTNAASYTLFSANDDAICIGWMSVTFPGGDKYANTIGNWASTCAENHGTGGTWYYSNVIVQTEEQGGQVVNCAWMDGNGDQPTTGVQIHWIDFKPESGTAANGVDEGYYCSNSPTLLFHTDPDPSSVIFLTKRNMFSSSPSGPSPAALRRGLDAQHARLSKRFANDPRLIKSKHAQHTATELCGSTMSVGPSFVSLEEQAFCHMPTRTVYPFCSTIAEGACWDDTLDVLTTLGGSLAARAALPAINFTNTLLWE